jgi:hypothetical protein
VSSSISEPIRRLLGPLCKTVEDEAAAHAYDNTQSLLEEFYSGGTGALEKTTRVL